MLDYNLWFCTSDNYNNVTYSVDKILIKSVLEHSCLNDCTYYLDHTASNYYQSFKKGTYRHLFTIGCENSSVCVKIGFNHPSDIDMSNYIVFEFNPNKMCSDDFKPIFHLLHFCKHNLTRVALLDVAIDYPFPRNWAFLRYDRENYMFIKNRTGVTEYTGIRHQHNAVKLYDKRGESGLDYDLTRLEITIDPSKEFKLPSIYINFQDDFNLKNNTDTCFCRALNSMNPLERRELWKDIERKKRQTLLNFVYSDEHLLYINKYCIDLCINYVYDMFILDFWNNINYLR